MNREGNTDSAVNFVSGENRRAFQVLIRALHSRECTAEDLTRYILAQQENKMARRGSAPSVITQTLGLVLPIRRRRSDHRGNPQFSLRTQTPGRIDPLDIPTARWSRLFLAILLVLFFMRFIFR